MRKPTDRFTKIVPQIAASLAVLAATAGGVAKAEGEVKKPSFAIETSEEAVIKVACLITCGMSCTHTDNC